MSGYWYLGSPYSKYPLGVGRAHAEVCTEAGRLVKHGHSVYSPIAMSHPIALHSGINPLDHDVWLPFDEPFVEAAKGLIVLKLEGWDNSYGLAYEIELFEAMGLPVVYMEPGTVPEGL